MATRVDHVPCSPKNVVRKSLSRANLPSSSSSDNDLGSGVEQKLKQLKLPSSCICRLILRMNRCISFWNMFRLILLVILTAWYAFLIGFVRIHPEPRYVSETLLQFFNQPVKLSIVILTYKKRKEFLQLLESIVKQKADFGFEIIIVDNGCQVGLVYDINSVLLGSSKPLSSNQVYYQNYKYIPLCDNPGYSYGNNYGASNATNSSQYVLFLNDDLVLRDSNFLRSMVNLFKIQASRAGAVGCMLLNEDGSKVQEAGSMVWRDGSTMGYARDRTDFRNSFELQYARPVDYVSGACLMIDKRILNNSTGFDAKAYPAYYEDTDLQMKIQHIYHKQVWLQPAAVALHKEHGSFGSTSITLMESSHKVFAERWKFFLKRHHIFPGPLLSDSKFQAFRASDLRGRVTTIDHPNVLYLDEGVPSRFPGGDVRSYHNLLAINDLGLRITLYTIGNSISPDIETNETSSIDDINHRRRLLQEAGIEVVQKDDSTIEDLENFLVERKFYYNVIVISKMTTYNAVRKLFFESEFRNESDILSKSIQSFAFVYDAPYLTFRREEMAKQVIENKEGGMAIPPGILERWYNTRIIDYEKSIAKEREDEVAIFTRVHAVVTSSDPERNAVIAAFEENATSVVNITNSTFSKTTITPEFTKSSNVTITIGLKAYNDLKRKRIVTARTALDIKPVNRIPGYENRNGILFIGSFCNQSMYHDGDAVWYFLEMVFPLILKEIPDLKLTIAGRGIPQYLYNFVSNNRRYEDIVSLIESPTDLNLYYDKSRIFVSPLLYTSGIHDKLLEAMASGMPSVISKGVADGIGPSISKSACVGASPKEFKDCVVSIYNDTKTWKKFNTNSVSYIKRDHQRNPLKLSWKQALDRAIRWKLANGGSIRELEVFPAYGPESKRCQIVDNSYLERYTEVTIEIEKGTYTNGLDHFRRTSSREGYIYDRDVEKAYLINHPGVRFMVSKGRYESGWDHFIRIGEKQGYIYSPKDEEEYFLHAPDVANAVKNGVFRSAWDHYTQNGRRENRFYGCL